MELSYLYRVKHMPHHHGLGNTVVIPEEFEKTFGINASVILNKFVDRYCEYFPDPIHRGCDDDYKKQQLDIEILKLNLMKENKIIEYDGHYLFYYSQKEVAEDCGMSIPAATKIIKRLEDEGVLFSIKHGIPQKKYYMINFGYEVEA